MMRFSSAFGRSASGASLPPPPASSADLAGEARAAASAVDISPAAAAALQ
jgi:hypothetical protein